MTLLISNRTQSLHLVLTTKVISQNYIASISKVMASKQLVVFNHTSYGKAEVGVLYVHRHDKYNHSISDFKVTVSLTLATLANYTHGDNSDIIATDTIKNTVYFLAHKHPEALESPERFGILICTHFLTTYKHILNCIVYVEANNWKRAVVHGKEHAHAFIGDPSVVRFTTVSKVRDRPFSICSGFKNLKLLKTTQSGFEAFFRDELTSLSDTKDRVFATSATLKYEFHPVDHVNFNDIWEQVLKTVVETFSGPHDTGVYSSSVQHTMYFTIRRVFEEHSVIEEVEMNMPNLHYFLYDLAKLGVKGNDTTFYPAPQPYGHISCKLGRSVLSKL